MNVEEVIHALARAESWDSRVALIRRVPEQFGAAHLQGVYSEIAKQVYVPGLAANFAFIHWSKGYSLDALQSAYADTVRLTDQF